MIVLKYFYAEANFPSVLRKKPYFYSFFLILIAKMLQVPFMHGNLSNIDVFYI